MKPEITTVEGMLNYIVDTFPDSLVFPTTNGTVVVCYDNEGKAYRIDITEGSHHGA